MAHRHHRRHHRYHRRNPLGIDKSSLTTAGGVAVGIVGSAALPAIVLPAQNSGITGYALNAASAVALKLLGDAVLGKDFGDNALAGGLGFTLVRIVKDKIPGIPGLSAYWNSFLPNFPAASDPYGRMASPIPPALAAAGAGARGMAGRGRFASRH